MDLFISVCIPAYNSEKFILETLNSVNSQTYRNWEIIVVEDASNDSTENIVGEFSRICDNKVIYYKNKKNLGVSSTRNIAANSSSGDWIAFIDSDDIWEANHLQELVETHTRYSTCDFIHGLAHIFDSDTKKIINSQTLPSNVIERFPVSLYDRSYFIQTSSVMISRKLFNQTGGFDSTLGYSEDLEFWLRSARLGFKFVSTGIYSTMYRKVSGGGLTSHSFKINYDTARVYDLHSDWLDIEKVIRLNKASEAWFNVARMSRKVDKVLCRQSAKKSIKYKMGLKNLTFWGLLALGII